MIDFEVTKSLLQRWVTLGWMVFTNICVQYISVISQLNKCMTLVCNLSVGAQLFVSPVPICQAEWRWPSGWFTLRGDATGQRCPFGFTRQPAGRRGWCSGGRQHVLLLPLQHYLPQPASRFMFFCVFSCLCLLRMCKRLKKLQQIYDYVLLFSLLCVFVCVFFAELQESYEQCFPPAEDDGDPTHEQRLPGHPAATSAGVSTGSNQRWVSLKHTNMHLPCVFIVIFETLSILNGEIGE